LQKPHKFVTLDGLRGVAALAVLQLHTQTLFGALLFPEGYLAVDFFFLLSGFVMAYAYQQKLDRGMSTMEFFKTRMVRLYPLYGLGLLIGGAFSVVQMHDGSSHPTVRGIVSVFLLGALWIPMPVIFSGYSSAIFPLNLPAWSLFYEICANIAHALFFRRRSWMYCGAVIVISGMALAVCGEFLNTMDFGVNHQGTLYAFFRVFFSYFLGNLLFRFWNRGWLRFKMPSLVSAGVLLAVLAVRPPGPLLVSYDLLVTILVFPILLLASSSAQPSRRWSKLFQALGTASYAIYVLHVPMERFFERAWTHIAKHEANLDAPWPGILFVSLVILVALVVDSIYDLPVRAYLRERLLNPVETSKKNKLEEPKEKASM
jgi:peptidoglycan/LPS O-acetylase OafA/YrhL